MSTPQPQAVQQKTGRYKTIVLDGVDRLQDLVTKKHMGLSDIPVQLTYMAVPEADWNIIGITLKTHLRDLLRLTSLGCNVVILGGERNEGPDRMGTDRGLRHVVAFSGGGSASSARRSAAVSSNSGCASVIRRASPRRAPRTR